MFWRKELNNKIHSHQLIAKALELTLPIYEKMVLMVLCQHYPNVFPGEPRIAKMASMSERQVRRCLRRLIGKGLIDIEYRRGVVNLYTLNTSKILRTTIPRHNSPGSKAQQSGVPRPNSPPNNTIVTMQGTTRAVKYQTESAMSDDIALALKETNVNWEESQDLDIALKEWDSLPIVNYLPACSLKVDRESLISGKLMDSQRQPSPPRSTTSVCGEMQQYAFSRGQGGIVYKVPMTNGRPSGPPRYHHTES